MKLKKNEVERPKKIKIKNQIKNNMEFEAPKTGLHQPCSIQLFNLNVNFQYFTISNVKTLQKLLKIVNIYVFLGKLIKLSIGGTNIL